MHDHEPVHYQSPVEGLSNPLGCYVFHGKIRQLEQSIVCREYGSGLCYLPELPVEAFNGVCCTYDFSELNRIGEVGSQFVPIVFPALDTDRISPAPFRLEFLKIIPCLFLCRSINGLMSLLVTYFVDVRSDG